jgi:predicted Fe-Mo cluster-binding NifX family protein
MKIAVPYDPETGLIFQHFGHTEHFRLYEVRDGHVVSAETADAGGAGHEALAGYLKGLGAEKLICGGIGGGAVAALNEAGVEVWGGITGLPDAAVEALLRGTLLRNGNANCDHAAHESGACGGSCGK